MKPLNKRIDIIDGFRGLAVLSVVLFHYYTRLELPYNWSSYGYYGVYLFFAVSGFVICQSLSRTKSFGFFFKHRLIRLMPSMIVCSIITYGMVYIAHPEAELSFFQPDSFLNFLPSWTFTPPEIWNGLFGRRDIDYIDSSYWSLWVEVLFYLVAGSLYYMDREKFLSRWLALALVVTFIRVMTLPQVLSFTSSKFYQTTFYHGLVLLNLKYWVFFSVGVFGFHIYKAREASRFQWLVIGSIVVFELCILSEGFASKILFLVLISLFVIFVKRPGSISFLRCRMFVMLGLISYPLYLIHQNVGLILIYRMLKFVSSAYLIPFLPVITLSLMIVFSYMLYLYFERPIIRYLRS